MYEELKSKIEELESTNWLQFIKMQTSEVKIILAKKDLQELLEVMKATENAYCVNKLTEILTNLEKNENY